MLKLTLEWRVFAHSPTFKLRLFFRDTDVMLSERVYWFGATVSLREFLQYIKQIGMSRSSRVTPSRFKEPELNRTLKNSVTMSRCLRHLSYDNSKLYLLYTVGGCKHYGRRIFIRQEKFKQFKVLRLLYAYRTKKSYCMSMVRSGSMLNEDFLVGRWNNVEG